MLTEKQIEELKPGDRLIFFEYGGVFSASKGNVFTFSNWYKEDDYWYPGKNHWQCKELHASGNHEHNFHIRNVDLFDESIHKEYVLMSVEKLNSDRLAFIEEYGE